MEYESIRQAKRFALNKHDGQKRKYTGEPYWFHLEEVAELVLTPDPAELPRAVVVAWLHDVLEDTDTTFAEITNEFGQQVAMDVLALSDLQTPADGNRAYRKAKTKDALANASELVQSVKLADLISNTSSIVEHDPEFAKTYLKEKFELLLVLTKGHKTLQSMAMKILKLSDLYLATYENL